MSRRNDPEYDCVWSAETRYLFDERLAILTDGFRHPPTFAEEQIARSQARGAHVQEVSFNASQSNGLHIANADLIRRFDPAY